MDPARQNLKRCAMDIPTVEKKVKFESASPTPKDDAKNNMRPTSSTNLNSPTYHRFGVLSKIVNHMRKRHINGDVYALTLDEILEETNQLLIGDSIKKWLDTKALQRNPKIKVTPDGQRFNFKPAFKIKDGSAFVRLLKLYNLKGLGGILLEDVQESLPHCDEVLKNCASIIKIMVRPLDNKKILFYNDHRANLSIDEDFQELWHSATDDAMDEY